VRRTAVAVLVVLAAACSGGGGPKATSSSVSSSGGSTTTAASGAGPSTTLDPDELSALDEAGAKAFLTLYANQLKERDPTLTQAQVDCVPDAVLDRLTPRELFALVDSGLGSLTPEDAARIKDSLLACGFSDAQVAKARVS
jgi:hypothetical protein